MGTKREIKKACCNVPSPWCHSGDATSNREGKREREEEKERERERERERARVDCRKRGVTCGDQKRGKESMSQRTITVVSQR